MIQRIQSIYLLLTAALMGSLLFFPSFQVMAAFEPSKPVLFSIIDMIITIIEIVVPVIALISIFLYKNRPLQIKLSYLNIVLILAYYIAFFAVFFLSGKGACRVNITVVAPVTGMVLLLLAIGAISKDDKLVKSMDRIR